MQGKKQQCLKKVLKCSILTILLFVLFEWYYTNMDHLMDQKEGLVSIEKETDLYFSKFMKQYNKIYTTQKEYARRKGIYLSNFMLTKNEGSSSVMGLN